MREKRAISKIGSGDKYGPYYSVGQELANKIYQNTKGSIQLEVEKTEGSVENINALIRGDIDFGFSQADRLYQAFYGQELWEEQPQSGLRLICKLYFEMMALLVRDSSDIFMLGDLRGKIVSVGGKDSGTKGNALDLLRSVGLERGTDYQARYYPFNKAMEALQANEVDAFFYTSGHPNDLIVEASHQEQKVRFVAIPALTTLLHGKPYYKFMSIPSKYYPDLANYADIATIGIPSFFLTHENVDEEVVYAATKAFYRELQNFKARYKLLEKLDLNEMIDVGDIPLHKGAKRFYQELGLL